MNETWTNSDDRPLIVACESRILWLDLCYAIVPAVFADGSGRNAKRVAYSPPAAMINDVRKLASKPSDGLCLSIEDFAQRFGGKVTVTRA
jgi:hypothetical protein